MSTKKYVTTFTLESPGTTVLEKVDEIQKYLARAAGSYSEASVRVDGSPEKFQGYVLELDAKTNSFVVEWSDVKEAQHFIKEYKNTETKELMIVIYLRRQMVLGVRTQLVEVDGKKGYFKIPEKLFRFQRRRDLRWVIGTAYEIPIKVGANYFPLVDISKSGLSFLVEASDLAKGFSESQILRSLEFTIQKRTFSLNAEIMSKRKNKNGTLVGIKFYRMKDDDASFIEEVVIAQNAHLLF